MIEVVVVGGGMAGVSAALALAARGAAVNVVEAERPASAATGASAGMLAPQYESPGYGPLYRLGLRSRAMWPDFAARLAALSGRPVPIRRDGMVVANWTEAEEAGAREAVAWQTEHGQRAELLSPDDAEALQPGLGPGARSWLWLPDEGQVNAQGLVEVFDGALAGAGVRLIAGVRVAELLTSGGRVTGVGLEDGRTLEADRVVLAAGAWSDTIGGVSTAIPVRPIRGQMLRLRAEPGELRRLVATHDGRYLCHGGEDTLLAGSTMEAAGFDRSLTDEGGRAIRDDAARLLPALEGRPTVERWADLRPVAEDGLPIVGPDPRVDGLVHATGYGRNGILLGPLTGEIVAEMVLEGSAAAVPAVSVEDLEAIRPDRFG